MSDLPVSFRLDPESVKRLTVLAKQTERNRSQVIRLLLTLADLPEARRLLGDPKPEGEAND